MTTLDARCVYCRHQPADPAWRPFCSERCRMADLGRWLTGGYNVPGEPAADEAAPDVAADQPRVELAADGPRVEKMTTNARDSDNHR